MKYPGKRAVDGLSFDLHAGQVTAFLGHNGAGKTTTIEVCEGLRKATSGTVRVFGVDPQRFTPSERARMGVMLQSGGIPTAARAVEFVSEIAALHRDPLNVNELCERLDLHRIGRTPYRRMSGGQKQTVALAAAVVGRPELLLLDEPTAGLDPVARVKTWELINELREAGVTICLSTHYMEEAQRVADTVIIADQGKIVTQGKVSDLLSSGSSQVVLTTSTPADLDSLKQALGPGVSVASRFDDLVISGPSADEISRALVRWSSSNDVVITSLRSGDRSLEDVFFELTGRDLQ